MSVEIKVSGGTTLLDAADLMPGDVFTRQGTLVKVIGEKEPCTDRFGQSLFRFMCERLDTHEQGYCTFGPGGVVSP